jgi:hypothetical protein
VAGAIVNIFLYKIFKENFLFKTFEVLPGFVSLRCYFIPYRTSLSTVFIMVNSRFNYVLLQEQSAAGEYLCIWIEGQIGICS